MDNNIPRKALFKNWCARQGYTPVRAVYVEHDPGHAALNVRHGWWTVSVYNRYDEVMGVLHLDHPIKGVTEEQARAFLAS